MTIWGYPHHVMWKNLKFINFCSLLFTTILNYLKAGGVRLELTISVLETDVLTN